ncbi:C40 family peptidase [Dactylosporangium sp. CA-233914]|uniref:C40 family peptidase n=1 Tax=Dactylosporangium sp. CA-233914 TaxID=3239934 RepID=UPI003D9483D6
MNISPSPRSPRESGRTGRASGTGERTSAPGRTGEPHLSTHPLRRGLAAATTACTIACTVLGGALISGNSTHVAASEAAAPDEATTTTRAVLPDRLIELRDASRGIRQPPPPAAAPARTATAPAPRTESARAETTRASRATRSPRTPRTTDRATTRPRPMPATGAPRTQTRRPARGPVAGYSGGGVVGFAMAQVGKGYAYGSTGPDEFDCSGLVVAAYRRAGINLPRSTGGLAGTGRPVARADLQPGDLIFPSTGHVGIYIGGGRMVHASTERGGVKISNIYAFRFARRVLN